MNDYYKITADLYNHQINFLGYRTDDDFSSYLGIKDKLEKEKTLTASPKETKKYYYSLFSLSENQLMMAILLLELLTNAITCT